MVKLPALNGKDSLTFFFDTGASTILLDSHVAEKFNIKADLHQEIRGAGGTKMYSYTTGQKIFLNESVTIDHLNFVLDDLSRLNATVGRKFDGIIGNDILSNYLTVINITKRQILLYPFKTRLDTSNYKAIDFFLDEGVPIPRFAVDVHLLNGEKLSGDILFDSGAALVLFFNTPFQQEHNLIGKVGKTVSGSHNSLTTKSANTLAAISSLSIGPYVFNGKLPVSISSDKEGVSSSKKYLGILGSQIIHRFDFILDYSNKKLYLKPNFLYQQDFTTAVAPFKIILQGGKVVIDEIFEQSAAYRCGLRKGQVITAINKLKTQDLKDYRKMLLNENKDIEVNFIDSDGQDRNCKFKIEKLL
ncbi:aspartyl protease family protein [Pedobacter terrae]|uniref:aspartyl protease family protein n=1 Tax=Pedobacter terrae TaxID=405671 RepID=UPI002FF9F543